MKKNLIVPLVVFIISLLVGAFILFLTFPTMSFHSFDLEINQYERQKEKQSIHIQAIKEEKEQLLAKGNIDSSQLLALDDEIKQLQFIIQDLDKELSVLEEERIKAKKLSEKQEKKILAWGIITIIIVSLIIATLAFFAQRLFTKTKSTWQTKLLLVFFFLCLIIIFISLGENEEGEAISFAILAGSALLSHSILSKSN